MMKILLRGLLRMTLKPALGAGVPVGFQRRFINSLQPLLLGPRRCRTLRSRIGGVPVLQVDPAGAEPGRGILYLHGGGYVVGGIGSHGKHVASVAHAAAARGWLVDYRLAPEHPYPAAVDDALAVYRALITSGQDPKLLTIAGDSAGGGLALATALAIREAGLPLPSALVLISPWVDLSLSGASMATHASRDPMLTSGWLGWCSGLYRGSAAADHPGCSPLFAELRGLPRVLIQAGSEEILLSDSERLAEALRAAGVDVRLHVYETMWHVFQLHARALAEADTALVEIGEFLKPA